MRFEEALKNLEEIILELEGEELPLEKALARYEEGVRLLRHCQRLLAEAEKKIEVLKREEDGSLTVFSLSEDT